MQLKSNKVILRDFIESDIEDRIYWETVETEWALWDAPWENEPFDAEAYRETWSKWLKSEKDENRMRWGFQICVNDETQKHIGWCNAYDIDDQYKYTTEDGKCTIGIDIPDQSSRRKGYGAASWALFIQYFLSKGIENLYTQTWSGNERVLGLIEKIGFEECHRVNGNRLVRGETYDGLTFKLNLSKYDQFYKENFCD